MALCLALLGGIGMAQPAHAAVDPLGIFKHRIEVDVPAFHGITPVVALTYASNAGNGFVGMGWRLVAGETITRVSKTHGAPRGDVTDRFVLDGNELVACAAGSQSPSCTTAIAAFGSSDGFYSTRIESFTRIRRDALPVDGWTIWSRDGTRRTLRTQDGGASYQLAAVTDTHGNTVTYSHWCDAQDACYPDTITYAAANGAPGASIRFHREPRPDPFEVSRANSFSGSIQTIYRLASVVVSMDGQLARAYRLQYTQGLSNGVSVLASVERFGRDADVSDPTNIVAGPTSPLPKTTLATPSMQTGRSVQKDWVTNAGLTALIAPATTYAPRFDGLAPVQTFRAAYGAPDGEVHYRPHGEAVGDFDGDGRMDWLGWSVMNNACSKLDVKAVLSTKTGYEGPTGSQPLLGGGSWCEFQLLVADLDGDGRDDLVMMGGGKLLKLLSRGDGRFSVGSSQQAWVDKATCAIGDLDGDGRADIACISAGMLHFARSLAGDAWSYGNDSLTGLGVSATADHLITAGDFDADGLADLTIATKTGSSWTLLAGTSDGTGFTWKSQPTPWAHGAAKENDTLGSGDFDGDGKSDVMLIRALPGPDVVYIGLSSKGATARYRLVQVPPTPVLSGQISTGDFDADGRTDLMVGGRWARGLGDGRFDAPTGAPFQCGDAVGNPGRLAAADLNGDGRDDVLCTVDDADAMAFVLHDKLTDTPAADSHGWMRADITGDGIAELVRIDHLAPGYRITVVSPVTQQRSTFDVTRASTGDVGLDEAATDRWVAMDIGSPSGGPDGKADLVLVDTGLVDTGLVDTGSGVTVNTLRVFSLLSLGDGTFTPVVDTPWRDANHNVAAYGSRDLQHWRAADVDGDGNGDLLHLVASGSGITVERLRSKGDGKWQNGADTYFAGIVLSSAHAFVMADISGDGLSDLVHAEASAGGHIRTLLGNGDGTFTERVQPAGMAGFRDMRRMRIADLNGDGMADLANVVSGGTIAQLSELRVASYLSDGNGGWRQHDFSLSQSSWLPDEANLFEDGNLVRFVDIDGDGRDDLVHLSTYIDTAGQLKSAMVVAHNPGPGKFWSSSWQLTKDLAFASYEHDPWRWQTYRDPATGDPGLLYVHPHRSQAVIFRRGHDHVTRVANGTGGATEISYAPLVGQRSYLPEGSLPEVVTAVEVRDESQTPVATETLRYSYGEAHYSHVLRRRLGFGWMTEQDHESAQVTYATFSDQCGAQPSRSFKTGLAGLGATYSYRAIGYVAPGQAPFNCRANLFDDYECESEPTCRLARREQRELDEYGNVISSLVTASQAPASLSYRPTAIPPEATKAREMNAQAYIVDKPRFAATYTNSGQAWTMVSLSTFAYDGNRIEEGPTALGELQTLGAWDGSVYHDTKLAYDAHGQLTRTEDPRGQVTTIDYDATHGLFATIRCEGTKTLCTEREFDPVLGQPTSAIDPNGAKATIRYDTHGRQTEVVRADGGVTATRYLDTGVVSGPAAQRQRIRTETTDGSAGDGVMWRESFFDGLGRTYRTTREGGATQDTRFTAASLQPAAISLVYAAGGQPPGWVSYAYDAAGRVVLRTAPDGSERKTEFAVGRMTTTDEIGHRKTAHIDGRGLVVQIDEHTGTSAASSFYAYDGPGRLVRVIDHLGHTTTVGFDLLGRRVSTNDPDRGRATYRYLANGLLQEATDAAGQTIRFEYDMLGRRLLREDLDPKQRVTRTVRWTWDRDAEGQTAGASLGRIVLVDDQQATAAVTTSYGYDLAGNVVDSQQCVDRACLAMRTAYDKAGRLRSITYPDATGAVSGSSETVLHTYDEAGRLATVGGYVTAMSYDPDDRLTGITYGNDVITHINRDPLRRWVDTVDITSPYITFGPSQRLAGGPIVTRPPIVPPPPMLRSLIYHAGYGHDAAGRIHSLEEANPTAVNMQYSYDELGRLVRVESTDPARREQFAFDQIGRLKWSPQVGDVRYEDPLHVHAATRTDGGYARAYDSVGNTTSLRDPGGRSIDMSWTVDGRLASLTEAASGQVTSYAYDLSGARVKKDGPQGTSFFFGSLVERRGGRLISYYVAADQLVARREGSAVHYYAQDLVHSTRVVTDAAGQVVNRYDRTAFGRTIPRAEPYAQDYEYVGGRANDESGLTYMNARYYDPAMGSFVSADTLVPDLLDPQSLHRYAFAQQDPINFWDPSGHMRASVERKKELEEQSSLGWMMDRARAAQCYSMGCVKAWTYDDPHDMNLLWARMLNNHAILVGKIQAGMRAAEEAAAKPLTAPPLVTVEQADAPFVRGGADEWSPYQTSDPAVVRSRTVGASPSTSGLSIGPLYQGHWPEMAFQAAMMGFTVTGRHEMRGHNPGSAHHVGEAIDVRTRDKTPEQITDFMRFMTSQGYIVRDERVRPPGQAVFSGPHIHVEAFRWQRFKDAFEPLHKLPPLPR